MSVFSPWSFNMQIKSFLPRIILSSVACHALPHSSTLSLKQYDFRKNSLLNMKCVYWISLQLCLKHFSLQEEFTEIWSQTYIGVHLKYPLRCHILTKLEFYRWIFHKSCYIKFYENPSIGSQVVSCGQTERRRHDEDNNRFSQFSERA